jgi:hypothetical protein
MDKDSRFARIWKGPFRMPDVFPTKVTSYDSKICQEGMDIM